MTGLHTSPFLLSNKNSFFYTQPFPAPEETTLCSFCLVQKTPNQPNENARLLKQSFYRPSATFYPVFKGAESSWKPTPYYQTTSSTAGSRRLSKLLWGRKAKKVIILFSCVVMRTMGQNSSAETLKLPVPPWVLTQRNSFSRLAEQMETMLNCSSPSWWITDNSTDPTPKEGRESNVLTYNV